MPANLKTLRKKIQSLKKTRKITYSMKWVSSAKFKRAELTLLNYNPYLKKIMELKNEIINGTESPCDPMLVISEHQKEDNSSRIESLNSDSNNIIFGSKDYDILIIITSSDRGLCGSFNNSIFKQTAKLINNYKKMGVSFKLIPIGAKAVGFFAPYKKYFVSEYIGLSKKQISIDDIEPIYNFAMEEYLGNKYGKVLCVYNHFRSAISQEVRIETLLPAYSLDKNSEIKISDKYEYEPDISEIIDNILKTSIKAKLYNIMLNNSVSEQAARMTAMDNATKSADKMINQFTLTYNRTRQSVITKELIEIISGAEALN